LAQQSKAQALLRAVPEARVTAVVGVMGWVGGGVGRLRRKRRDVR
jgi:hypothetical protein